MASKVKGSYVVTPADMSEEENGVGAIAFPKASLATEFVTSVQEFARKKAASLLGLNVDKDDLETMSDDEKKAARAAAKAKLEGLPQVVPMDVLIQRQDAEGQPDGEPIEFETYRD